MKTELACLPCFFRQVTRTLRYAGVNGDQGRSIAREAVRIVEDAPLDQAPARISTRLHRLLRERTGVDPYRQVKEEYNRIALAMLPALRELAGSFTCGAGCRDAKLAGAVRAAIAGNSIDFGIYDSVDLERALQDAFSTPLAAGSWARFEDAVHAARNILYLCDNAGEVVFDRILIEQLTGAGKQVIAAVKGVPVINDATLEDAAAADLRASACTVLDNGSDGIGTLLETCSSEFLAAYRSADLIISKGQANYETLVTEEDPRTFFLFMVKCPVVASGLGRDTGEIVLLESGKGALKA